MVRSQHCDIRQEDATKIKSKDLHAVHSSSKTSTAVWCRSMGTKEGTAGEDGDENVAMVDGSVSESEEEE